MLMFVDSVKDSASKTTVGEQMTMMTMVPTAA